MFSTLFWALYWIDVLSEVKGALLFGGFAGAVGTALYVLVHDHEKLAPQPTTIRRGILRVFIPIVLVVQLLNLVPKRDTMYMMLAVRTTDVAVNSDTGQRLLRTLNKQLDKYIEQLEK